MSDIIREKRWGRVTVDSVKKHEYKDDVLSAQIRQTVTKVTIYPGKNVANDKQDSLYPPKAFGGEGKEYKKPSHRVTWIDVPLGETLEDVQKMLDSFGAKARIYQIVSTDIQDCLTDSHRHQIEKGNLLLKDARTKREIPVIVNGKTTEHSAKDTDGDLLYREVYFSKKGHTDVIKSKSDTTASIEIEEQEILGAETRVG